MKRGPGFRKALGNLPRSSFLGSPCRHVPVGRCLQNSRNCAGRDHIPPFSRGAIALISRPLARALTCLSSPTWIVHKKYIPGQVVMSVTASTLPDVRTEGCGIEDGGIEGLIQLIKTRDLFTCEFRTETKVVRING